MSFIVTSICEKFDKDLIENVKHKTLRLYEQKVTSYLYITLERFKLISV